MPTVTQEYGYSVTNVGPLTTRFTPAPSCATATDNVYFETMLGDSRELFGFPDCAVATREGCLPSGKEIDSLASQLSANPHNGNLIYHSPGLRCPSGWTTVGKVTGGGGGNERTDATGVFSQSSVPTGAPDGGPPDTYPRVLAYIDALAASETLAWCCPKGFKANTDAECTSDLGHFSSFTYSERCEVYIPTQDLLTVTSHQGTSLKNPVIIVTSAATTFASSTFPIEASETKSLVVVTHCPVVALVYQESDKKAQASRTGGEASGGDEDSASGRIRPGVLGLACAALAMLALV